MGIFDNMKPDAQYKSLLDIPFEELKAKGIVCALLDFDNTLGPDRCFEPDEFSFKCVDYLNKHNMSSIIVSNAKSERSAGIAKKLGLPCVNCACKPGTSGVKHALELMKVEPSQAVMIGDQLFTDIMAGKKSGVYSIFVDKYQPKEIWYVAIKRPLERLVRKLGGF